MSGNFSEFMTSDFLFSVIRGEPNLAKKTCTTGDPFLKDPSKVLEDLPGVEEFNKIDDAIALVVKGESLKKGDDISLLEHFASYSPADVLTRKMCALVIFEDRTLRDKAFCDRSLRRFNGNTIEISSNLCYLHLK